MIKLIECMLRVNFNSKIPFIVEGRNKKMEGIENQVNLVYKLSMEARYFKNFYSTPESIKNKTCHDTTTPHASYYFKT